MTQSACVKSGWALWDLRMPFERPRSSPHRPKKAPIPGDQMAEAICARGILAEAFWQRARAVA